MKTRRITPDTAETSNASNATGAPAEADATEEPDKPDPPFPGLVQLLILLQLVGYVIAVLAWVEIDGVVSPRQYFRETVLAYMLAAALGSMLLHLVARTLAARAIIIVKIVPLTLLVYTVPHAFWQTIPPLIIALAEISFRTTRRSERFLLQLMLIAAVIAGISSEFLGVNVFQPGAVPVSTIRAFTLAGLLALVSLLTSATADYAAGVGSYRALARQQRISLDNLSEFNQRLQRWAQDADSLSAERERNRISRELHDISGYMFTNLIGLMEAAISTGNSDPSKVSELLMTARKQAQEGLRETRIALRKQREVRTTRERNALRTIHKIASIFEQVTGTKVRIHFGNLPERFDPDLNHTLYRVVQESLTNAIRHGKATLVELHFWIDNMTLIVNIHDNGSGSTGIMKGIGLTGIEERLARRGGRLEAGNAPQGGFRLHFELPLGVEEAPCYGIEGRVVDAPQHDSHR